MSGFSPTARDDFGVRPDHSDPPVTPLAEWVTPLSDPMLPGLGAIPPAESHVRGGIGLLLWTPAFLFSLNSDKPTLFPARFLWLLPQVTANGVV